MNKIRGLIVMTVPFGNNGISKVLENLYYNIRYDKLQCDFVFLNEPSNIFKNFVKMNGLNLFIIPNRVKNPMNYAKKLYEILNTYDYNFIHVHGNSHIMALELIIAKMLKVPLRIAHSHSTSTKFPILNNILTPIFNYSYNLGVACSNEAGIWLFGEKKFILINNAIDVEKYYFDKQKRINFRDKLDITDNEYIIGHVGGFTTNKNQKYLIDLMNKLDSTYKLVLIGNGHKIDELAEYVKRLGLSSRVYFLGEQANINEWLNALDCFVLPSFSEGFPLVLIEAQSNGLPTFVSDTITKEVNISNQVQFFSINNFDELTDCLLIKPNRFVNKKYISIITASKYNIKNTALELENIYYDRIRELKDEK